MALCLRQPPEHRTQTPPFQCAIARSASMDLVHQRIEARTESDDEMAFLCLDFLHEGRAVETTIRQKKLAAKLVRRRLEGTFTLAIGSGHDAGEVVVKE